LERSKLKIPVVFKCVGEKDDRMKNWNFYEKSVFDKINVVSDVTQKRITVY